MFPRNFWEEKKKRGWGVRPSGSPKWWSPWKWPPPKTTYVPHFFSLSGIIRCLTIKMFAKAWTSKYCHLAEWWTFMTKTHVWAEVPNILKSWNLIHFLKFILIFCTLFKLLVLYSNYGFPVSWILIFLAESDFKFHCFCTNTQYKKKSVYYPEIKL